MGYIISMEDVNGLQQRYPNVQALAAFSQLVWFEAGMLYSRRNNQASMEDCKDACMSAFTESGLRANQNPKISPNPGHDSGFAVRVGSEMNPIRIQLTGMAKSGDFICSACGLETKDRLTGAHNVIPSSVWKLALGQMLEEFAGQVSNLNQKDIAQAFTKPQLDELGHALLTEAARSHKFQFADLKERKWHQQDQRMTFTVVSCGEDEASRGATTYEGGQCKACEELHSNMSLIQRIDFTAHHGVTGKAKSVMISASLISNSDPLKHAVDQTRRVFELVLNDMGTVIVSLQKQSQLAQLFLNNDKMFVDSLWAHTLAYCKSSRGLKDSDDRTRYEKYLKTSGLA